MGYITPIILSIICILILVALQDLRNTAKHLKDRSYSTNTGDIIIMSVILILGIVLIPWIFTSSIFADYKHTGAIGDTIGGITAPFVNGAAAILVYLALKEQVKANNLVVEQFDKQNSDQLFYRLMDNLQTKIINYTINPNLSSTTLQPLSGYGILHYMVEQFRNDMIRESGEFGRVLMSKRPEEIVPLYYMKMLQAIGDPNWHDADYVETVRSGIINVENDNDRWEYIKDYFNSRGAESKDQRRVLEAIGSVYFYKTPFKMRYDMYSRVYQLNFRKHAGFIDGYMNNIKYILKTLDKIKDKVENLEYLKSSLSFQEKTLILYHLAAIDDKEFADLAKKYTLLDDLYIHNTFFIDWPSPEEFKKELSDILEFKIW